MSGGPPIIGNVLANVAGQCGSALTGTTVNSADVNTPFQAIENDIVTIQQGNLITFTGRKFFTDLVATVAASEQITLTDDTAYIKLGSSGIVRARVCETGSRDDGQWTTDGFGVRTCGTANPQAIYFTVKVPHLAVVTDVFASIVGAPAHVGLPGQLPTVRLNVQDIFTPTASNPGGIATDASGTTAAFQVIHSIHLPSIAHTYDETRERLIVEVHSEGAGGGGNNLAGDIVYGVSVTYTQPRMW